MDASPAKAFVVGAAARFTMLASDLERGIPLAREALAMAEELGLEQLRAAALTNLGTLRMATDPAGEDDLRQAIEIATAANIPFERCRAMGNLASHLWQRGHLSAADELWQRAHAVAKEYGQATFGRWFRGIRTPIAWSRGRWNEALELMEGFLAEVEAGTPHYLAPNAFVTRAQIRLAGGDELGALADATRANELTRKADDPQNVYGTLPWCAYVYAAGGRHDLAVPLVEEMLAALRDNRELTFGIASLHLLAATAEPLGYGNELVQALRGYKGPWVDAAAARARGDVQAAADLCARLGAVSEEALDRLVAAERLAAEGERAGADAELASALAFFRSVGASRYVRRGEALLAASA